MPARNQNNSLRGMTDARAFAILATCRFLMVIFVLGIGLTLMGIIMTTVSYDGPFANDDFFKKQYDPIKIVGPVFLGIGLLILCCGIVICVVAIKTGYKIVNRQPQNVVPDPQALNQSNDSPLFSISSYNYNSQQPNSNLRPYGASQIHPPPVYPHQQHNMENAPYPVQQYITTEGDLGCKVDLPPPYSESIHHIEPPSNGNT